MPRSGTEPPARSAAEDETSWLGVLAIVLLLILGVALPFWMEYRSLADPAYARRPNGSEGLTLDALKKYYCPACGGHETDLPNWRGASGRAGSTAPLVDKRLARPEWAVPVSSASAAAARMKSRGEHE